MALTEAIWLAVIVSVVAPTLTAIVTNWQLRMTRREDYRRQDEVARRAKEAVDAASSAAIAVTNIAKVTNTKLSQIKALVDGGWTGSIRATLESAKRELTLLNEVVSLKQQLGFMITQDTEEAIRITQDRITQLSIDLMERERQEQEAGKIDPIIKLREEAAVRDIEGQGSGR